MTIEIIDGIRVLKLKDAFTSAADRTADMRTLAHIWMLLGGDHSTRDASIFSRRIL